MSAKKVVTDFGDYLIRVGLSVALGLVVYQLGLSYFQNANVALALMAAAFVANLFAPGIITGAVITTVVAVLTYNLVYDYATGRNLPYSNLFTAEVILILLSYAIPLYAYVRTRTVAALAWGLPPFFVGVALVANYALISLPSGSLTPYDGMILGIRYIISATIMTVLVTVAVMGLTGVSVNARERWILIIFPSFSYLSLLGVSGFVPYGFSAQAPFLVLIAMVMGSLALFLVNHYEGSTYKLLSLIPISLANFSLFSLFSSLSLLEDVLNPLIVGLGEGVAAAVLIVPEAAYKLTKAKEQRHLFFQKRINLLEEINNLNTQLTSILKNVTTLQQMLNLDEAYVTALNNIRARLNEISNGAVSCEAGNLDCLTEIETRLQKTKESIKNIVSDVLFDARTINANILLFARDLGVPAENLVIPREKEIIYENLSELLDEAARQISQNMSRIKTHLMNLNNILINMLGSSLEIEGFEFYSIKELVNKLKTINLNEMAKELGSCIQNGRMSLDLVTDPRTRTELLDKLSRATLLPTSYAKFETSYNVLKKLADVLSEDLENLLTMLQELKKSVQFAELSEREALVKQAIATLYQNKPLCRKFRDLNSYRYELLKSIDLVKNKDTLIALNNLVNNMLPILRAKKTMPLKDLGVKEEFIPIFVSMLRSKGLTVRVEGEQLVVD
ncbi:MAG: hypothetical protein ACP5HQ_02090 [Thermoprotei archaeon]